MTVVDTLEDDLDELEPLEWDLGGYRVLDSDAIGVVYDDKLDSVGEVTADDADGPGDGITPGLLRIESRAPVLGLSVVAQEATEADMDAAMRDVLHDLRLVLTPLPDRYNGLRLLRWRRKGEPAKRLWYRPGPGEPLTIPGDQARILYNAADVLCHIEAPDPTIYSDLLHTVTLTAGDEIEVVNAGSLCPREPNLGWSLSCSNPAGLTLTNVTHGATWKFPAGPVTVSPQLDIVAPGTYGIVYGPGSTLFPAPMGLRPGVNVLKASADCTFSWRDTY
jgi:hypothetical protein